MKNIWTIAAELEQCAVPFVIITMVSNRGHAPQDPGAKALVTSEGLQAGTVGGGKVEMRAIEHAIQKLQNPSAPELVTWNLQRDIGMTCGGEVTYLFEMCSGKTWDIAIFGAGHVAQALVRALEPLDCRLTCVDARQDWIDRLPSRKLGLCVPEPATQVKNFSEKTFFVVMTQGHAFDVPILAEIFRLYANAPYIGVIGSTLKGTKIRNELLALGISAVSLEKLRCPIGLEIGDNHPAEIALSVAAELLQVRDHSRGASP